MPRRARLDAPDTLHHVFVQGIERRRIVDDVADHKNFVKRLGELSAATKTGIYAWALMTNHAHILLRSGFALAEAARQLGVSTRSYQKSSNRPINSSI
jgi:putative transposase